jgi:superfamily II DNA or RNA helicase
MLRDYQSAVIEELKDSLIDHSKIVISCPTGSGKTILAIEGIIPMLPKPIAWITHRVELAEQVQKHNSDITLIMSQSRNDIKGFASIIVDEGHHVAANSYQRIISDNPNAIVICLTATPYRGDGIGLGSCGFSKIISGPDIYTLTQDRWLCPAKVFVPVSETQSEWTARAATFTMMQHNFTKALVYSQSIKSAYQMMHELSKKDIPSAIVTSTMKMDERNNSIMQFKSGDVKVLLNHTIFTEGNDIPGIDMIVLNRFTYSRCLWRQMTGRGLRPSPKKEYCTVLDLAGNGLLHGSIYDKEIFSLDGSVITTTSRECPSEIKETEIENQKQKTLNKGESLKLWTPKPKPIRIIESLQRLKLNSPLQRLRTGCIAC